MFSFFSRMNRSRKNERKNVNENKRLLSGHLDFDWLFEAQLKITIILRFSFWRNKNIGNTFIVFNFKLTIDVIAIIIKGWKQRFLFCSKSKVNDDFCNSFNSPLVKDDNHRLNIQFILLKAKQRQLGKRKRKNYRQMINVLREYKSFSSMFFHLFFSFSSSLTVKVKLFVGLS